MLNNNDSEEHFFSRNYFSLLFTLVFIHMLCVNITCFYHHTTPSVKLFLKTFWHIKVLATKYYNLPDHFFFGTLITEYVDWLSFDYFHICLMLLVWSNYPVINSFIQIIEHFIGNENKVVGKREIVLAYRV